MHLLRCSIRFGSQNLAWKSVRYVLDLLWPLSSSILFFSKALLATWQIFDQLILCVTFTKEQKNNNSNTGWAWNWLIRLIERSSCPRNKKKKKKEWSNIICVHTVYPKNKYRYKYKINISLILYQYYCVRCIGNYWF